MSYKMPWQGNLFHFTDRLWGESTRHHWDTPIKEPEPWFSIKMSSYRYRKSNCGDKTILRPSYLHNGISYTGKITYLYWIRAQVCGTLMIHLCLALTNWPHWTIELSVILDTLNLMWRQNNNNTRRASILVIPQTNANANKHFWWYRFETWKIHSHCLSFDNTKMAQVPIISPGER